MAGGITEEQKERLNDKLDENKNNREQQQPQQPTTITPTTTIKIPLPKEQPQKETHITQRKSAQINKKELSKYPTYKYPIQNKTLLQEDILLLMVNDQPNIYGIQVGDIWKEIGINRTSRKNIIMAVEKLEKEGFLIKSKIKNTVMGKEYPLYRINPKVVSIEEITKQEREREEPPQKEIEQKNNNVITKESIRHEVQSERITDIEVTQREIKKILNNNEHILPIIQAIHKMNNAVNHRMDNFNLTLELIQNVKNTRHMPNEGLKRYYDGKFEGLDERLTLNMHPIGKQLDLKDLFRKIRQLERINLNHARLPELYRELSVMQVNICNTYEDMVKMHLLFEKEIWKRLTAPQRKEDRAIESMNDEAIDRMKEAKDEIVE